MDKCSIASIQCEHYHKHQFIQFHCKLKRNDILPLVYMYLLETLLQNHNKIFTVTDYVYSLSFTLYIVMVFEGLIVYRIGLFHKL